jgi:molecular chaperone GrpE
MSEQTRQQAGAPAAADENESRAAAGGAGTLDSLRSDLEAAAQERDEYLDLLQRSRAEFANYQKRNQRELADERRYAHAPIVRDLLPALDNLQRALEAARRQDGNSPLIAGLTGVQSQLSDVLRRFGIVMLNPAGEPFDPNLHEAVSQEPSKEAAPGTVIRVLEPGYRLHDRILRPARVVVAKPDKPDKPE